jgi:predicted transcriptional regulator
MPDIPPDAPCANMYTSAHEGDAMSTTMTIRLEEDVKARLEALAESTQRSRSFLAAEAIREYLEANEWQVAETLAALQEADSGDFADPEEVDAVARKWGADAT